MHSCATFSQTQYSDPTVTEHAHQKRERTTLSVFIGAIRAVHLSIAHSIIGQVDGDIAKHALKTPPFTARYRQHEEEKVWNCFSNNVALNLSHCYIKALTTHVSV